MSKAYLVPPEYLHPEQRPTLKRAGRTRFLKNKTITPFGQWQVVVSTGRGWSGIESRNPQYTIDADRLNATILGWKAHMAEKSWVNMWDFIRAFDYAVSVFGGPVNPNDVS